MDSSTGPTSGTTGASAPSAITPARSVTPASVVTPATSTDTPAATVVLEPSEVRDTSNPTSRVFPLMGVGVVPAAALPDDHPQVVAARASNDGTATLDTSRAAPAPVAPASEPVAAAPQSPQIASGATARGGASSAPTSTQG